MLLAVGEQKACLCISSAEINVYSFSKNIPEVKSVSVPVRVHEVDQPS